MRAQLSLTACWLYLLVTAQVVLDGWGASQSLVDLHGGTTRIRKHLLHALALQSLHQDV